MGIFDNIGKKIEAQEEGIRVSDLLDLPPALRTLMNRAIRDKELTPETAAQAVGESVENTCKMLDLLVEKGYLRREKRQAGPIYQVHYGRTHPKDVPGSLWGTLDKKIEEGG